MDNSKKAALFTTRQVRYIALAGNLGLLFWVILWHSVLSPHPHLSSYIVTIAWVFPLLLPIKGVLEGKPYTHAWANFILMFYFLHSLTILWVDEGERGLAIVELALAVTAFIGNSFFARRRGRELGLGLKKLSQIEKEEREAHEPKR